MNVINPVVSAIYVLSSPDRITDNMYKIGRTSQQPVELLSRYKTPLIYPIILAYIPCLHEVDWEKRVHAKLFEYRVHRSEWFQVPLSKILTCIGAMSISQEEAIRTHRPHMVQKKVEVEEEEVEEEGEEVEKKREIDTPFAAFLSDLRSGKYDYNPNAVGQQK